MTIAYDLRPMTYDPQPTTTKMSDNDISMTPGTQGVLHTLTKPKYQEFLHMLPPLILKDKEEDKNHVITIGPWLDNCEEIF
ncbi:hypothetical protein H4S07_002831 [Coemansia furcata]|uniref:Uncharacterized protein n=1 Tax=Coemansia furcata TaxID=417177 RepID=A0ACC1LJE5_9FUNG|nr:hypothetical protein H4S07_002831 [Coemansia furcata]